MGMHKKKRYLETEEISENKGWKIINPRHSKTRRTSEDYEVEGGKRGFPQLTQAGASFSEHFDATNYNSLPLDSDVGAFNKYTFIASSFNATEVESSQQVQLQVPDTEEPPAFPGFSVNMSVAVGDFTSASSSSLSSFAATSISPLPPRSSTCVVESPTVLLTASTSFESVSVAPTATATLTDFSTPQGEKEVLELERESKTSFTERSDGHKAVGAPQPQSDAAQAAEFPNALLLERRLEESLKAARAAAEPVESDENLKKQRREVNKALNVHIQQITATQEQIRKKSKELLDWWRQNRDGPSLPRAASEAVRAGWPAFLLITMAQKFIAQTDLIMLNEAAVFPFVEVIDSIVGNDRKASVLLLQSISKASGTDGGGGDHGGGIEAKNMTIGCLIPLLLGIIQEKTSLSVPKIKKPDDAGRSGSSSARSTSDASLDGLMMLFGAIVQRIDVAFGWTFLVWLLKGKLPACSSVGRAAYSSLKIMGYELYNSYGDCFEALLRCLEKFLLPDLEKRFSEDKSDADLSGVIRKLRTYIYDQDYKHPPNGFEIPDEDQSSFLNAAGEETSGGYHYY